MLAIRAAKAPTSHIQNLSLPSLSNSIHSFPMQTIHMVKIILYVYLMALRKLKIKFKNCIKSLFGPF